MFLDSNNKYSCFMPLEIDVCYSDREAFIYFIVDLFDLFIYCICTHMFFYSIMSALCFSILYIYIFLPGYFSFIYFYFVIILCAFLSFIPKIQTCWCWRPFLALDGHLYRCYFYWLPWELTDLNPLASFYAIYATQMITSFHPMLKAGKMCQNLDS